MVKGYNELVILMIKKVFPILALSMFSSTLGIGIVMPLLPIYITEMGASGIWLGIIVSSYAISNAISVPIAGRLSDIKGRKIFLVAGLFSYSLISLGYIYSPTVYLLSVVRFFHGIAGAMTIPVAIAFPRLQPCQPGKRRQFRNSIALSPYGLFPPNMHASAFPLPSAPRIPVPGGWLLLTRAGLSPAIPHQLIVAL